VSATRVVFCHAPSKLFLLATLIAAAPVTRAGETAIADLSQGTNMTVALAPNVGTLVVGLVDQLWRVPAAGGGAEALTPADETARNPRYSPDGRSIVYQRLTDGQWDLWLLDLGTGDRRALTSTALDEIEPDFTADGRAVVFVSNRTGHFCVWSVDLASGVETQLTEETGDASFPSASELGPIAYLLRRGAQQQLRVLLPSGVTAELVSRNVELGPPSWRPGGGVLVFSERDGTTGSRLRMLVLGDPVVDKPITDAEDIFFSRPAWLSSAEFIYAADGQIWRRAIALQSRQPVHVFAARIVEARPPPADLPLLDEPGPQIARGIAGVSSSPDGRRTAFTALGDVWLSERGALRRLTDDVWVDLDPTFAPDGGSVVFSSERSGQFELWRVDLRGGAPSQITFGALSPRHPVVSGDGRRVAFIETDPQSSGAHERLAVTELSQPGRASTIATGLSGARPSWGADGKTLTLRVAAAPTGAVAGVRFEIGAEAPSASASEAPPRKGHPNAQPLGDVRWSPPAAPDDYVVEVGRLFDAVRAEYRRHVDVHVSGGRIAAIVGRGVLPTPAKVIDARDATVVPGFVDVHAHQSALAGERLGRIWLAYGVTTVRELAPDVAEAVERGESWANGRPLGPRLIVSPGAGAGEPTPSLNASALVPVRGYPGISLGLGHELARLRDASGRSIDSIALRRESGTAASPYELELSPDLVSYQDAFATLTSSLTVLPSALGAVAGLQGWPDQPARGSRGRDPAYSSLFTPAERAAWAGAGSAAAALPRLQQTVARLVRAGGRLAIGSDAPSVPYGLGVHFDLGLLAAAGLPNDQTLRIATAGGALALGLERQIGTLEDGKIADFVVIDGDPLERLTDTLRITAVVKGGVWIDRAALLASP
jgi:Tol biopolymer transport system component